MRCEATLMNFMPTTCFYSLSSATSTDRTPSHITYARIPSQFVGKKINLLNECMNEIVVGG